MVLLVPNGAAQGRYVNLTKAKASSPTHPPLLLAGSKVPKRQRLYRPLGHPLGLNPAGVLLFRMRADAGGRYVPLAE